jgi:hypothetical protein
LEDRPFTLRTDNAALSWLYKFRDEKGKLARWAMLLRGFQFTVEHVPGETNKLPDALSRFPGGSTFQEDERDMERFLHPNETRAR